MSSARLVKAGLLEQLYQKLNRRGYIRLLSLKNLVIISNLLENMVEFSNKPRSKTKEDKDKKINTFDSVNVLYQSLKLTLNAFKSEIFPIKATKGTGLKILTPKQWFKDYQ